MNDKLDLDAERLAQKIRWEGGLWAAPEYGIRADDVADPELADLWSRLERGYRELAPLLDETRSRLDVAA